MTDELDHFTNMLADSDAFRTFVGAANRTEALPKIQKDSHPQPVVGEHREFTQTEIEGLRPYALIWRQEDSAGFRSTLIGAPGTFSESGRIKCQLIRNVPALIKDDLPEVARTFRITVDLIKRELYQLRALATTATYSYLAFTDIVEDIAPGRLDAESEAGMGDAQGVELGIEWGEGDA